MPHPGLPKVHSSLGSSGVGEPCNSSHSIPLPSTHTHTRRRSCTKPTTCSPADGALSMAFPIWKDKFAQQPRLVGHFTLDCVFARFQSTLTHTHTQCTREGDGDKGPEKDGMGEKKRRAW
ncbi:hypothetical protein CGRA01v4_14075 [Colletotrichum graminicola]|nr:hypothetical protein CGRA01v4_14075 [Colletotrichum graminicola]